MNNANPSDSVIVHGLQRMAPELRKRYSLQGGCSCAQIHKTALDLGISADVIPYLGFAFASDDQLPEVRKAYTGSCWEEVEKRSERLCLGLLECKRTPEGDSTGSGLPIRHT